jgi:hypothetical protein
MLLSEPCEFFLEVILIAIGRLCKVPAARSVRLHIECGRFDAAFPHQRKDGLQVREVYAWTSAHHPKRHTVPAGRQDEAPHVALDLGATVSEAVEYARSHPMDVVSGEVPDRPGSLAPLHLMLCDATGEASSQFVPTKPFDFMEAE